MTQAYIFLTTDFEEIEAISSIDILRRGEVAVKVVSLTGSRQVLGRHHVLVTADCLFEEEDYSDAEMLILPGGTTGINDYPALKSLLDKHLTAGKKVGAICAAPMVLGEMGVLAGKTATAYPGFEQYLKGATVSTAAVVVDGDIITGKGPGFSQQFALTLLAVLKGDAVRHEVAKGLLLEADE